MACKAPCKGEEGGRAVSKLMVKKYGGSNAKASWEELTIAFKELGCGDN